MEDQDLFNDFEVKRTMQNMVVERQTIVVVDRDGNVWENGPTFTSAKDARYAFSSVHGGWVPVEVAVDTLGSNSNNYGQQAFEGEAVRDTCWGPVLVQPSFNSARLAYSGLSMHPTLLIQAMQLFDDPGIDHLEHTQRTAGEFYDDAERASKNGEELALSLEVVYKDGRREPTKIPFGLSAQVGESEHRFSLKELNAIPCVQAYLNNVVRCHGNYPEESVDLIPGGYIRRLITINARNWTKIPAIKRDGANIIVLPFTLSTFSFPWGPYLSPAGYETGIPLLKAPYLRIDSSMPVRQKTGGNYLNSQRNIHWAILTGCGEILALNHQGKAVEGSAENLVFLFTEKRSGKMRVYFPALSDDILAGTTRERMRKTHELGLVLEGQGIEVVYEAPKYDYLIECLKGRRAWTLDALVLFGTGVKLIHANEIVENDAIRDWADLNEMASEESPANTLMLADLKKTEKRYPINGKKKHPFVDLLNKEHDRYVIGDGGSRIVQIFDMDYHAVGSLMGVDFEQIVGKTDPEFVKKVRDGRTAEKINGITHPDELKDMHKQAIRAVFAMHKESMAMRSKPVAKYVPRMNR